MMGRKLWLLSGFWGFLCVFQSLAQAEGKKAPAPAPARPAAQSAGVDSNREPSFGRGGLDLGWGKTEESEDEDEMPQVTPTPSPTPKKDDSFFKQNVEDTGAGDRL